jgi:hypothetical protein
MLVQARPYSRQRALQGGWPQSQSVWDAEPVRLCFSQWSLQKRFPGVTPQLHAECAHLLGVLTPVAPRVSAIFNLLLKNAGRKGPRIAA